MGHLGAFNKQNNIQNPKIQDSWKRRRCQVIRSIKNIKKSRIQNAGIQHGRVDVFQDFQFLRILMIRWSQNDWFWCVLTFLVLQKSSPGQLTTSTLLGPEGPSAIILPRLSPRLANIFPPRPYSNPQQSPGSGLVHPSIGHTGKRWRVRGSVLASTTRRP